MSDFSQPERHHSNRELSDDTSQPIQAADRKIARLPFALRLLAHPTYGAQGISDDERKSLLDAARRIEEHDGRVVELIEMIRDLSTQCDQLRAAAA